MTTQTLPAPATADRLVGQRLNDIPTPPAVRKRLDAVTPVGDPSRAALERDYKLSFLYGGQEIAVRGDGAETEILKAGTIEEVADSDGWPVGTGANPPAPGPVGSRFVADAVRPEVSCLCRFKLVRW